ncbi:MAG: hypothetical protein U0835_04970 [Isosphaeraceae bacterium]
MGDEIPAQFRTLPWLRDLAPGEDEAGALSDEGRIAVFLAHVPAPVRSGPVYQRANMGPDHEGWMPEGQCGLFGINALEVHDHPDGDGVLILGLAQ